MLCEAREAQDQECTKLLACKQSWDAILCPALGTFSVKSVV